jgi:hypothetical protein
MGLAEDRASLLAAANSIDDAVAHLQAAGIALERAEGQATNATGDFDNVDLMEATGAIVQINIGVSEQLISAAGAATRLRDYVARMS